MAEEVDLSKNLHDQNNWLNTNEQHFISHVLALFAASDQAQAPSSSLPPSRPLELRPEALRSELAWLEMGV